MNEVRDGGAIRVTTSEELLSWKSENVIGDKGTRGEVMNEGGGWRCEQRAEWAEEGGFTCAVVTGCKEGKRWQAKSWLSR